MRNTAKDEPKNALGRRTDVRTDCDDAAAVYRLTAAARERGREERPPRRARARTADGESGEYECASIGLVENALWAILK